MITSYVQMIIKAFTQTILGLIDLVPVRVGSYRQR